MQRDKQGCFQQLFCRTVTSVVLLMGVCFLNGCDKQASPTLKPLPVRVTHVMPALAADGLSYSASIQPQSQVNVSFRTDGYIRDIETRIDPNGFERILQPGDVVKQGDVMAQVDTRQYQDNLQQAQAKLSSAKADLLNASQNFKRARALQKTNSITGTDFDTAQRQFSSAEANVQAGLAAVDAAQLHLSETALLAPFEGTVIKRLIEVGALVHAGTPGFVLANTRSVQAIFGVPDTVLAHVRLGAPISVITAAYPVTAFAGNVTDIAPAANERTRVFDITVTINNPQDKLKAGMVTSLVLPLETAQEAGVMVPLSSVVEDPGSGNFSVFVVAAGSPSPTAQRRVISVSRVIGNNILVTSGLRLNEQVVSAGANRVIDGQAINIVY